MILAEISFFPLSSLFYRQTHLKLIKLDKTVLKKKEIVRM